MLRLSLKWIAEGRQAMSGYKRCRLVLPVLSQRDVSSRFHHGSYPKPVRLSSFTPIGGLEQATNALSVDCMMVVEI